MRAYDVTRELALPEVEARNRRVLEGFVAAVLAGDVARVERLLAADVRACSDAGGEYVAALNTIVGCNDVARFFVGLGRLGAEHIDVAVTSINGLPALRIRNSLSGGGRFAPRTAVCVETTRDGLIRVVHSVLASRKLVSAGFEETPAHDA
jgi:RNA polymerase sigma-70 factor (ECF subfamily)